MPVYIGSQEGLKENDKISSLPGQPSGVNFDQYSGYVTVDKKAGRALFYYFVESINSSSTTPLVLWLNGGPGCSSFGAGAMTELGPFRVSKDGSTLWKNPYAWNQVANVIFLESPAGVGFSYSNTTSDYNVGDHRTASDAYKFLVNWLERFPEYKTRDFYITGESYAGHYVPQLAQLILHNNKITNQTFINLKGVAIGNAYIDYETQNMGSYDYAWSHALISDEVYKGIISNCNFTSPESVSDACKEYTMKADGMVGNIDPYNIYYPLCTSTSTSTTSGFDPCSGNYRDTYLNTPQVQKSLHVNLTGSLPGPWSVCSGNINWADEPDTVLDVIQELMTSGLRVWLYSGDTDSVVAVTTTRYAIDKKLKQPIKTPWHAWYYQGEVGGYAIEYEDISLVTVRGAGHLVPSYQPGRALTLFISFINGELPPSN